MLGQEEESTACLHAASRAGSLPSPLWLARCSQELQHGVYRPAALPAALLRGNYHPPPWGRTVPVRGFSSWLLPACLPCGSSWWTPASLPSLPDYAARSQAAQGQRCLSELPGGWRRGDGGGGVTGCSMLEQAQVRGRQTHPQT